jgi:hypothetical protein
LDYDLGISLNDDLMIMVLNNILEASDKAYDLRHIVCIFPQNASHQVNDLTSMVPKDSAETSWSRVTPGGPIEVKIEEA